MTLIARLAMLVLLLGAAVAAQAALDHHLASAGPAVPALLRKSLAELPMTLGAWRGEDVPVTDPRQLYADDYLQRTYWDTAGNQVLSVWIAYSRDGKDRGHHPEVCMSVAGKPEDASVRQTLDVPGHEQPVQQYCFGRTGESQWVFYWHYTLPSPDDDQ